MSVICEYSITSFRKSNNQNQQNFNKRQNGRGNKHLEAELLSVSSQINVFLDKNKKKYDLLRFTLSTTMIY